jgi:hypothetical protein
MFPLSYIIQYVNNHLERMLKEIAVVQLKALSHHLAGWKWKNYIKAQSG